MDEKYLKQNDTKWCEALNVTFPNEVSSRKLQEKDMF